MNKVMEKLVEYGADRLTNEELIKVILGNNSKAEKLLGTQELFNDVLTDPLRVISQPMAEIKYLGGLTTREAAILSAAATIGKRIAINGNGNHIALVIDSPRKAAAYLAPFLAAKSHEIFVVILLDARNKVIRTVKISEGSLSASCVHPRECFTAAVIYHAASIICAHNHPSGLAIDGPSDEDRKLTKAMAKLGQIVGIPLLDHCILGRTGDKTDSAWNYYSFQEHHEI